MSAEENKAIVRRFMEAYNSRNMGIFEELVAPDYYDHVFEQQGRENLKNLFTTAFEGFPDWYENIEDIIAEGDKGDGAYFILEGKVQVSALSQDFKEILLGELGEDEVFGEMALIDDKPRSASVVTLTPCKLAFVGKNAFNEFIETRSELAFRLMGFVCLSLFRRILRLDRLYSDVKKR